MKNLDEITTRDELKIWCKANAYRLPRTKDLRKAIQELHDAQYRLTHHGDAFCDAEMLERRRQIDGKYHERGIAG